MAQLTVRKVPEEVVRELKLRAARHGRSAEAEHRALLEQLLKPADDFWQRVDTARRRTSGRQKTDSVELLREFRHAR